MLSKVNRAFPALLIASGVIIIAVGLWTGVKKSYIDRDVRGETMVPWEQISVEYGIAAGEDAARRQAIINEELRHPVE